MRALPLLAALVALVAAVRTPALPAQRWDGVAILMFHRVDADVPRDAVGRSLTLEPARFESWLSWLQTHHVRSMTTAELVDALAVGEHPRDAVVFSFDDGYEDAATVVTPLLRKYGARASFYVSADLIGTPRHATWRELRAMQAAGMEIGCHGSRHLDLTTLSRGEQTYEIGHCAQALAHYLRAPRTYAYAAGKYDPQAISIVRRFGFSAALTEHPGAVTSLAARYELPRRRIDRDGAVAGFAQLVAPR